MEDVIYRPLITEKNSMLQKESNAYTFEVNRHANKAQIRDAVKRLFNVEVESVRTLVMPKKWKRHGKNIGCAKRWKKAVVTLAQGQTIDVFQVK